MARPRKDAVKRPDALLATQEVAEIPVEEQPYPLPEGWKWVRLSSLCSLRNGRAFKPSDWSESGLPIVRIQNLNNPESKFNFYGGTIEEKFLLKTGDLLFAWSGTPGTSFGAHIWNGGRAVLNQHIFRIDFKENYILKSFFRYSINNHIEDLITKAHGGAGLQHVTKGVFENTPIPLPSLDEQQRIVDRIESLFAKLDEAKDQAEAVLDGYETRKAAILHKAFTGELTKTWRIEHGHKKEEWHNLTLNDVAKWGSGGTPSRKQPEYYAGNIAWVKTGELNNDYLYETEEHITKDAIKNSSAKIFPKETVIIAMYGATIGQCAILGIDAATNQACACGIVRQNTYNKFLFNYLISQKNNFISLGKGGAQPNISQTIIKEYPLSLPSLPEQREIVQILDILLAKEQQVKDAAENVLEQIELMKKSILARAFRGS